MAGLHYEFSKCPSSSRHPEFFQHIRNHIGLSRSDIHRAVPRESIATFYLRRIQISLSTCKDSANSPKEISYIMIHKFHPSVLALLLISITGFDVKIAYRLVANSICGSSPKLNKDLHKEDSMKLITFLCDTCKLMEWIVDHRFISFSIEPTGYF